MSNMQLLQISVKCVKTARRLPKHGTLRYRASMKHCVLLTIILLALGLAAARAQSGPDERYVGIFSMIEQADALAASGQPQQAQAEYQAALTELQTFAGLYPAWGTNIITFREQYLADKIAATTNLVSTATPPATGDTAVPPASQPPAPAPAGPGPDAALTAQLADLRAQVDNLQAGNTTLEVKLREALAAQPATVDPHELAAAQEQVRSLMKENDLLRVSLEQPHGPAAAASLLVESNALAQARESLAGMGKQLAQAMAQASQLSVENQALQAQTKKLMDSREGIQALREENEVLKKQLTEAKASAKKNSTVDRLQAELAKAQAEIATLKAAARQSEAEKAALLAQLQRQEAAPAPPATSPVLALAPPAPVVALAPARPVSVPKTVNAPSGDERSPTAATAGAANVPAAVNATLAEDAVRIQVLEQQRDVLQVQLMAARQLWGGSESRAATNALVARLSGQLQTLQARLAVVEAQRVPYSSEELALFRQPAPVPKPVPAGMPPINEPPTGLMASADGHFSAHEYDQAAGDYQQLLQHDENNGLALANLAAVELSQSHLPAAEKHILAAVALSPDDAYNLAVLGHLRLEQQNYDAALDSLGRAARLDPNNADIQVWLGITLGQQGLRQAAETALRQALVLAPDNAEAHNNLAVIYISETPPRAALARWHYLKALAAGQPHNAGLEKMLADNGAAVANP